MAKISDGVEKVLQAMEANGGSLSLGDKSTPKEIHAALGISKKVFMNVWDGHTLRCNVRQHFRHTQSSTAACMY